MASTDTRYLRVTCGRVSCLWYSFKKVWYNFNNWLKNCTFVAQLGEGGGGEIIINYSKIKKRKMIRLQVSTRLLFREVYFCTFGYKDD